jgi:hypothetical protein
MVCACVALAACGGKDDANVRGEPPIVPVQQSAAEPRDTAWVVTPDGIGAVRVGMSASEAIGVTVDASDAPLTQTCAYVKAGRVPAGVGVMANGGVVARIDVDSGTVATAEGARIGDSEARIRALYAGRVTEQPHKYTSGRYLIVTPADPARRIVFETDGRVVTAFRAGRQPEVEWVEKCG